MIKEISTYGALILTVMVVIRAATIEEEGDISGLYERHTDQLHIQDNLVLRDSYDFHNVPVYNLLADLAKVLTGEPIDRAVYMSHPAAIDQTQFEIIDLAGVSELESEISNEIALLGETNTLLNEDGDLSLDRESTINSRLSLLFPRQRIQPKPSPGESQE